MHIGIQDVEIAILYEPRTMHEPRYLKSIRTKSFQNVFAFDSRKQSCFCPICIEDTRSIEVCENIVDNYVKDWKQIIVNQNGNIPLKSLEKLES